MNFEEIKLGNLIKVSPREHQEGYLTVKEIQHSSAICEMISPRKGYEFRIKPLEMQPVPLDREWLASTGFIQEDATGLWSDSRGLIKFDKEKSSFQYPTSVPVKHIHEFQNEYFRLTGVSIRINY